jgi:hypothetical protein
MSDTSRAARFAAAYGLLRAAAAVGDHWVQTDHQAVTKGQYDDVPGQSSRAGRTACVTHVATYTATQALALAVGGRVLGIRWTPARVAAVLTLAASTHAIADRRRPLQNLADAVGNGGFYRLGAPRPGHDDNPSIGTGAYALDAAWHHAWETAAALILATGR